MNIVGAKLGDKKVASKDGTPGCVGRDAGFKGKGNQNIIGSKNDISFKDVGDGRMKTKAIGKVNVTGAKIGKMGK